MKTISVVVPTYNEEENIPLIYQKLTAIFNSELTMYDYEILFIDNCSQDRSQEKIVALADADEHVKAIFNAKNFGFSRSTFYGITQVTGDCCILINADMQDPPEIIIDFVKYWENGYKIVIGIKNKSKENKLKYLLRATYYKLIKLTGDVEHIEQYDGFGLYDYVFIEVLRNLDDSLPYLRGIVAELGFSKKEIYYTQDKRKFGKTKFSFFKTYDLAMLGITSYTKIIMRLATLIGFCVAAVSFIIAVITFFIKIFNWNYYPIGTAAISIGMFFFGAVQLFFIGFLGEYVLNINSRVLHRPLVIEEKRIGFKPKEK